MPSNCVSKDTCVKQYSYIHISMSGVLSKVLNVRLLIRSQVANAVGARVAVTPQSTDQGCKPFKH